MACKVCVINEMAAAQAAAAAQAGLGAGEMRVVGFDPLADALLAGLLHADPAQRLTAAQVGGVGWGAADASPPQAARPPWPPAPAHPSPVLLAADSSSWSQRARTCPPGLPPPPSQVLAHPWLSEVVGLIPAPVPIPARHLPTPAPAGCSTPLAAAAAAATPSPPPTRLRCASIGPPSLSPSPFDQPPWPACGPGGVAGPDAPAFGASWPCAGGVACEVLDAAALAMHRDTSLCSVASADTTAAPLGLGHASFASFSSMSSMDELLAVAAGIGGAPCEAALPQRRCGASTAGSKLHAPGLAAAAPADSAAARQQRAASLDVMTSAPLQGLIARLVGSGHSS